MRSLSGSHDLAQPALHALGLILSGAAAPVWRVAGLTLGLTLLVAGVFVLALSAPLSLVLAPLVLACRSRPDWRWSWMCRPDWFLKPWSWFCRCWREPGVANQKGGCLG